MLDTSSTISPEVSRSTSINPILSLYLGTQLLLDLDVVDPPPPSPLLLSCDKGHVVEAAMDRGMLETTFLRDHDYERCPSPPLLLSPSNDPIVNIPRQVSHIDPSAILQPSTLTPITLSALPDPKHWESELIQRIQALSALDMALIYKSFLQSALPLLPQINLQGCQEGPSYNKLVIFTNHYLRCSRGFRDINPQAWSERHCFDMDSHASIDPSKLITTDR